MSRRGFPVESKKQRTFYTRSPHPEQAETAILCRRPCHPGGQSQAKQFEVLPLAAIRRSLTEAEEG